jgi:hypothetical protein
MITKRAALSSRRAEAQDNAIEHLLDRARGDHGKRVVAGELEDASKADWTADAAAHLAQLQALWLRTRSAIDSGS